MADVDEKVGTEVRGSSEAGASREAIVSGGGGEGGGAEGGVVEHLGVFKYVFAAFFGAGIGLAWLMGKLLAAGWSYLVEWPWAVRTLPVLLRHAEDERATYTMAVGAVVGVIAVVFCLRHEGIRHWADDVAIELSKVTWPKKETVTNGTIVVIAAGLFATIYIGLLDRLWGFVTMLVYGA
jgi:preprotein translocase subunit SecE